MSDARRPRPWGAIVSLAILVPYALTAAAFVHVVHRETGFDFSRAPFAGGETTFLGAFSAEEAARAGRPPVDWYVALAKESGMASVRLGSTRADAFLVVDEARTDGFRARVAEDDDAWGGRNAQAVFPVSGGAAYWIGATVAEAPGAVAPYVLRMDGILTGPRRVPEGPGPVGERGPLAWIEGSWWAPEPTRRSYWFALDGPGEATGRGTVIAYPERLGSVGVLRDFTWEMEGLELVLDLEDGDRESLRLGAFDAANATLPVERAGGGAGVWHGCRSAAVPEGLRASFC